jgi:CheY-like chemotaxis protein
MGTVLVVEDEFGIAELIEAVLEDEGHRVLTAVNGRQGLEVLARERPDLVFLDYMMPVMDGAGMLRGMAANPHLDGIPVVMMSAVPEATVAERCSGYRSFLHKPFRITEVVTLAERLISKDAAPSA